MAQLATNYDPVLAGGQTTIKTRTNQTPYILSLALQHECQGDRNYPASSIRKYSYNCQDLIFILFLLLLKFINSHHQVPIIPVM